MKKFIKTVFRLIIFAIIVTAVYVIASNIYTVVSTKDRIYSPEEFELGEDGKKYDCILILGAGVRADGTPSKMLEERLETGLKLYNAGVSGKIIVSGDHGTKEYDEVNAMKSWLIGKGVPSQDIFMDHAGFSTYDSIYRAKAIFMAESACIVSQKYHLYRAVKLSDSLWLSAVGVDATEVVYKGQLLREAREIAARSKDLISGFFRPKPKYLGAVIPVFGDGDETNDKTQSLADDKA